MKRFIEGVASDQALLFKAMRKCSFLQSKLGQLPISAACKIQIGSLRQLAKPQNCNYLKFCICSYFYRRINKLYGSSRESSTPADVQVLWS